MGLGARQAWDASGKEALENEDPLATLCDSLRLRSGAGAGTSLNPTREPTRARSFAQSDSSTAEHWIINLAMAALRHLLQRAAFVNLPHRSCSSTPIVAYKFPFLSKFTSGFSTHEPSDSLPVAGSPVVGAADGAVDQSVVEPDLNGEDGLSSFKPRVANLPEDLTPEQLSEISAVDGSSSLAKKFSQKEGQDEDVALPYFTKAAQVKGKEPMVLAEAIKELKVGSIAHMSFLIPPIHGLPALQEISHLTCFASLPNHVRIFSSVVDFWAYISTRRCVTCLIKCLVLDVGRVSSNT